VPFRSALRRLPSPDARGALAVLRRPSALALQALLLVALVAGAVAYVTAAKTVALAVDGTSAWYAGDVAHFAVCGRSSLTHRPHWPCCENWNFDGATGSRFWPLVMVVIRCPLRTLSGRSASK